MEHTYIKELFIVIGHPLFYLCPREAFSETPSPKIGLSAHLICSNSLLYSPYHNIFFLSVIHVIYPSLLLSPRTEITSFPAACFQHLDI